ncbi:MAG: hypothetical protein QMD14_05970 [Candidatus Aenigmarchaeota archaeon]|nr:hypothetical protein [Candidatus Aenigmarchaeota archaeon]
MKAQAKITDLLGVLLVMVTLIVFLTQLPKLFSSFYTLLALHHPKVVSEDLAGIISISAATPADIKILYESLVEGITYDVKFGERKLTIILRSDGEIVPKETKKIDEKIEIIPVNASATFCVDGLKNTPPMENKKKFEISKKRIDLTNEFSFRSLED